MAEVMEFLRIPYSDGNGCGRPLARLVSGCGYGDGSGYGCGYGSGYGEGYGSGYGNGCGYGEGYGEGYGSGYGYGEDYGDGDGEGIKTINGEPVYLVDGVETIIRRVHGNVAKGAILKLNLTLAPCFIVKQGTCFAHGETLRKAMDALRDKLFDDMPVDERIEAFVDAHEWGKIYPDSDFYDWHHRLTGSCEMGRNAFAQSHGLGKLDGMHTVEWFIELTQDAYGGEVIRRVREAYENG